MRLLARSLAFAAVLAAPAHARPPAPVKSPQAEPRTEGEKVDAAIQAWRSGDWARVRALLEPMLQNGGKLQDPLLEEAALRYLADATLQDPDLTTIGLEIATGYTNRLLAAPDWRPPADTHSKQFYDLYNTLREQRDLQNARQCRSELAACSAELAELKVRHKRLADDHDKLVKAYNQQEVEVQEKVARNRAVALVPFGVGHFYNGRKGLGALFLTGEIVFGGVGLGMLLHRQTQCDRTAGFKRGSLICQGEREVVVLRRNVEQTFGLLFVGAIAVDILVAQLTFRPYLTVKKTRVRRSELDAQTDDAPAPGRPGRKAGGKAPAPAGAPRARLRTHDILQVRPAPAFVPGGAGLGVHIGF